MFILMFSYEDLSVTTKTLHFISNIDKGFIILISNTRIYTFVSI